MLAELEESFLVIILLSFLICACFCVIKNLKFGKEKRNQRFTCKRL